MSGVLSAFVNSKFATTPLTFTKYGICCILCFVSDINISAILNHPLTGVVVAIYTVIAVTILIVYPKYRRDAINNIAHAIVFIVCIIALGSSLQDTLTDHLRFRQEVSDFSSIIEQICSTCLAELEEECRLLLPINAIEEAKIILNNYSIPYPNSLLSQRFSSSVM